MSLDLTLSAGDQPGLYSGEASILVEEEAQYPFTLDNFSICRSRDHNPGTVINKFPFSFRLERVLDHGPVTGFPGFSYRAQEAGVTG